MLNPRQAWFKQMIFEITKTNNDRYELQFRLEDKLDKIVQEASLNMKL